MSNRLYSRRLKNNKWQYNVDRFISADPGLERLYMGAKAALAAGLATLVLFYANVWTQQPISAIMIGVTTAMASSVMVNDPTLRQQKITMIYIALATCLSLILGTLIAGILWLKLLVFLVIIFISVFIRRYGPRGVAVGTISFLTYFFALFTHAEYGQLPWMIASTCIGIAIAYIVHFWIIPDRVHSVFISKQRAFRARINLLLYQLILIGQNKKKQNHQRDEIRETLEKLSDTSIILEDELDLTEKTELPANIQDWLNDLREAEAAAQTLVDTFLNIVHSSLLSTEGREEMVGLIEMVLNATSREEKQQIKKHLMYFVKKNHTAGYTHSDLALDSFQWAIKTLLIHEPWKMRPDLQKRLQEVQQEVETEEGAEQAPENNVADSVKQAVKATVAGGLAIFAGFLISDTRWYWAVIAAFVVFTGTNTVGETVSKAWERSLGTILGVIGGLILAKVVGGKASLELAVIYIGIFLAFYTLKTSYTLMITFLTMVLGLLYKLLGIYQPELLILRLEETLAGAAVGALTASLIFPYHSRVKMYSLMAKVIKEAGHLFEKNAENQQLHPWDIMLKNFRELDRKVQEIRKAMHPLEVRFLPLNTKTVTKRVRAVLALASSVRHYLLRSRMASGDPDFNDRVNAIENRLIKNTKIITDRLNGENQGRVQSATPLIRQFSLKDKTQRNKRVFLEEIQWLNRINKQLLRISKSLENG